jgi:hypothetical protein
MSSNQPLEIHSYVELGRSKLRVSPICFGTWQLSPRFWGDVPETDVLLALHRALDLGVNFIDTADAYGNGYSEEVIGRGLVDFPRDQVVLATKAYWRFREDDTRYPDLSAKYLPKACEASLRRLKTDYIDLYQCHGFDPLTSPDELIGALDKLKAEGKIRHYGTSNWSAAQIEMGLERQGEFATCQPQYNLVKRDAEQDLLPFCQAHNIGVMAYSPLHHGLLTGKYRGHETFGDFRSNHPDFQADRFGRLCERVSNLSRIGKGTKVSIVQTVLAAVLMHPAIQVAVVGIKRTADIEEAVGAAGKSFPRDVYFQIRSQFED